MTDDTQKKIQAIVASSVVKAQARQSKMLARKQVVKAGKKKVADVRAEADVTGEPTTAALAKWSHKQYLNEFVKVAGKSYREFNLGPEIRCLADVKRFTDLAHERCEKLHAQALAPRSLLNILREAGKRLKRWQKESEAKKGVGVWMLSSFAHTILDDLQHMIYGVKSLRHLLEEELDSRPIEIKAKDADNYVLSLNGQSFLYHKIELERSVKNKDLRARLGFDSLVYNDPDGTSVNL